MDGYLSKDELAQAGFAAVGDDVWVHRTAVIINPSSLMIGDRVRIDAYAVVTCGEEGCSIGSFVHVGPQVFVAGMGGFDLRSYSTVSAGARLMTTSDDFSGAFLTGPLVPPGETAPARRRIVIGEHAVVGVNSVVIAGGELGEGAVLGALSLAKRPLAPWFIHAGVPARALRARSRELLGRIAR